MVYNGLKVEKVRLSCHVESPESSIFSFESKQGWIVDIKEVYA